MRIAAGEPEWPFFAVYVYGQKLKGVMLADEEEGVLRVALFDAQGNILRTPQGEVVTVEPRVPFTIRPERLEVSPAENSGAELAGPRRAKSGSGLAGDLPPSARTPRRGPQTVDPSA